MKEMVLPAKFIKQMSEKAKNKANKRLILSHLISAYILSLIFEARKGEKDRHSCIISTQKLIKCFKDFFPFRIQKVMREELHQLEVTKVIVIERFNFPQVDYVPTEKQFNLMVKTFKKMTENDILFLETKLLTIFYVKVINEATHELLATEDVKMGDTIPMLRTYFRLKKGELEWIIPKKSAKEEVIEQNE